MTAIDWRRAAQIAGFPVALPAREREGNRWRRSPGDWQRMVAWFHALVADSQRRSLRTKVGRRAQDLRGAVGRQLLRLREDAGVSQRRLASASGVQQSFISDIERGRAEPSIAVLIALGDALGADLTIRFYPGAGPRIRDRLQAPIVEALLARAHPAWHRLVEVPVWRPVRGVIDVVLARPGEVVVVGEIHSEVHRLEQQLRWAAEKAEAVRSSDAWAMLTGGQPTTPVSRLLVLRSTQATRDVARAFSETLRAAYPASVADALAAFESPTRPWPGATLLWADVDARGARILGQPPRGIDLRR